MVPYCGIDMANASNQTFLVTMKPRPGGGVDVVDVVVMDQNRTPLSAAALVAFFADLEVPKWFEELLAERLRDEMDGRTTVGEPVGLFGRSIDRIILDDSTRRPGATLDPDDSTRKLCARKGARPAIGRAAPGRAPSGKGRRQWQ